MHIILGVLGTLVTILILINRLQDAGIDIRGLNPFAWRRRRKFRKEHDLNPAFKLTSPMEVTALLMTAILKMDGEITQKEKEYLLMLFQQTFHLNENDTKALLRSSIHLLGTQDEVFNEPAQVLSRSRDNFTPEQARSLTDLLYRIVTLEGEPAQQQKDFIAKVDAVFANQKKIAQSGWN